MGGDVPTSASPSWNSLPGKRHSPDAINCACCCSQSPPSAAAAAAAFACEDTSLRVTTRHVHQHALWQDTCMGWRWRAAGLVLQSNQGFLHHPCHLLGVLFIRLKCLAAKCRGRA